MAAEIRVLFFATARQAAGCAEATVVCEGPSLTVEEFWSRLVTAKPGLAALRSSVRLARNREYLSGNEGIRPGDEVALIPPVSGG